MNRISYNLAELPLPATMPGWAKDLTVATQKVMDQQYLHGAGGLDNFYDQAESWIQTQTIRRANSGDPKHYAPADPFLMAIPRRQIVTSDADGNMGSSFLDPDPGIQLPSLPAWVDAPPVPEHPFTTHPPESSDGTVTQLVAAIMQKLIAIEQRLTALDQRLR